MQAFQFAPGDTSQTVDIFLPDSSSTTGAGLGGLVFNTASLIAYYRNTATGTVTAMTLATQTVGGAWSSGGFVELDATHAKGMYRFDLPNTVLASAGNGFVYFSGAANLAPVPVQIVVGYPKTDLRQAGGQAQTLDSNNVLNVSTKYVAGTSQTARDLGASVLLSSGTGTGQLNFTSGVVQADAAKINGVATSSVTAVNANVGTTQPVNFTGTGASALVKSDMVDVAGAAVSASTAQLGVNLVNISGSAVSTSTAQLGVNAVNWAGSAAPALVNGWVPAVTPIRSGTAAGGGASTITLDAGASATNNLYDNELIYISGGTGAGQVNTVSSYVGSTKVATMIAAWATNPDNTSTFVVLPAGPISATVSGGVNVTQWNGSAVAAPNVAGVPLVDLKYTLGTLSAGTAGYVAPDWGHVNAPTTTVNLSGTTISTGQAVGSVSGAVGSVTGAVGSVTGSVGSVTARVTANTDQLAGQTVTAGAGVTFPTSVASPSNITGGTITTVTNLTNAPTAGDFTATMKTSLNAATPTVTLTSGERDSVAAALLDLANGVETGKTLRQALRLMAAALAGKRSNSGTAAEQFDAVGNPGTARVVGNLNASGDGTPTLTP